MMSSTSLLFDATQVPHETNADARHAAEAEDARTERRLKDAVRRYYALAELVETERGYVDDLRVLVEVYLTSLGAISVPALGPRAEAQSTATPGIADEAGSHVSTSSSRPGPSSSRAQSHSYHYPPSSFPSSAAMFKDHAEPKSRTRARPASIQVLSVLQPQHAARSRRDSGLEVHHVDAVREDGEDIDREVKVRGSVQEERSGSGFGAGIGIHMRARSAGFGLGNPGGANSRSGVRRASVDSVPARPIYHHTYTTSPDSSPHPSPSLSPSVLPSIPSSPSSSQSLSTLPTPSHTSQRLQRLRSALTDADRQVLARDAQEILALHERIVRRVEDALGAVQRSVAERKRTVKGKERAKKTGRAEKEREDVEREVEAAVRAVCGVFVAEASSFTPYGPFCAGHTEALDTTRRAMRLHASEWLEWEKRCAEAAARRDVDGTGADTGIESPLPSPSSSKPVARRASRNGLLSGVTGDGEDAHSSTSTLRRRHSACASPGSLRASASASLKHTKSDPTPPLVGYGHSHAHAHTQGYALSSACSTLSVKRVSRGPEDLYGGHASDGNRDEKERQRVRSARMKLAFSDYLIKPVQRVCKYPLLFEQLRAPRRREEEDAALTPTAPSALEADDFFAVVTAAVSASRVTAPASTDVPRKRSQAAFSLGGDTDEEDEESDEINLDADESDTDAAIERVLRKMRDVARAVDEAQRRRDLENKSALIVERLVAGAPGGGSTFSRPIPIPDTNAVDDEKGSVEDGAVKSCSELGHGAGAVSGSTSVAGSMKPPTRSLSFSSAFSRPRSGFGRTNSAFMQQLRQQPSEFEETTGRNQVPGPPTRAFLSSLGACLLAGSLDVVVSNIERAPAKPTRYDGAKRDSMLSLAGMTATGTNNGPATAPTFIPPSSREPVKVKYLAAFLYVGGYIVLAKTPKAGVYEPRHWFALTDETIEVMDVREEKALLPCSFHLVFHATGHRLELAAACQREKEIWLNAIHHARSLSPIWDFEPVPTLNISANLMNAQTTRNSVDVPPVPSIPAIGDDIVAHEINPSRMSSNSTLRSEATVKPNRRQPVNSSSVRAFFMNSSDNAPAAPATVLIRRVSATRRAQTDRLLVDVLSQPLLSARFHAKAHDEVLFRDPDPPQQGMGIGVGAMAKNKLMARESVLVSKQCAPSVCSSIASSIDQRSMISDSASSITVQRQSQSSTRGKGTKKSQSRSSLGMLLTLPSSLFEGNTRDSRTSTSSSQGAFSPDSPIPSTSTTTTIDPLSRSQCSSASTSAPTSSPLNELFPPEVRVVGVDSLPRTEGEELPEVLEHMDRPKRSRSLVDNFRGFFGTPRSLSSSPAPSMSSSRQASVEESLEVPDVESGRQGSMLSRILRSTSFRPRGRSASDFIDGMQASSSASYVSPPQAEPARLGFITRSSSMLVIPRRRPSLSARASTNSTQTSSHFPTPAPPARLNTHPSRSSLAVSEACNQKSLGRSIKYRLFPGSLVPLTPIERSHDHVS